MKDKRFWFGVIVSVFWVGIAVYFLRTAEAPSKLNEWGDFIAGFSAPLAFFWLVLGYMQQGEELRHSTEALRLQAEELKNSVEQQSQLVATSREQIQMELQALNDERERRQEAARPKFVLSQGMFWESSNSPSYEVKIKNIGRAATDVSISFSPGANAEGEFFSLFDQQTTFTALLEYQTDADFAAEVSYFDSDDVPGKVIFPIRITRQSLLTGRAERVA